MNTLVEAINSAGRAFVPFSLSMLIQSGVLVLVLFLADLLLRRRIRAVVRYWIWTLVLLKLVLPVSLSSPAGVGTWLGGTLDIRLTPTEIESPARVDPLPRLIGSPDRPFVSPTRVAEARESSPMQKPSTLPAATPMTPPPSVTRASSLSWQGVVLLTWAVAVLALLVLLIQRVTAVGRMAAESDPASAELRAALDECRRRMQVGRTVSIRTSPQANSPAVCGWLRPTILVPQGLAPKLRPHELHAVLMHELAHVRRGDLWINLVQTLLQVVYFYNPLLWLANATIRRVREQAVDETVLVAMGKSADQYPETLVAVARLALANRPTLALRLIGVVESKGALTARIKHILARPIPKSAKLGLLGLLAILVTGVVLLPMAKGNGFGGWFGNDVLIRFHSEVKPNGVYETVGNTDIRSQNYTVSFRKGETLVVVAELYQGGRPMRTLGCKTFPNPGQPEKLSVTLERRYLNDDRTAAEHSIDVTVGGKSLRVNGIRVDTATFFNNTDWGFFPRTEIAKKRRDGRSYSEFDDLLAFKACTNGGRLQRPWIWMPGHQGGWADVDAYLILVRMLPLSQLDILRVDRPIAGGRFPDGSHLRTQIPDGSYLSEDASGEKCQAVADEYLLDFKRLVMRSRMPLRTLTAHRYYRSGEPIWVYVGNGGEAWKPSLEEIYVDPDVSPCYFLIDGKEYDSRHGMGPFGNGSSSTSVTDDVYVKGSDLDLPVGKHTVAYGWKDLNVTDPNEPGKPLHFTRLATDPVQFEIVEQLPPEYYRPIHEKDWEEVLRSCIKPYFTDDRHQSGYADVLLGLRINGAPCDIAFDVYVQAEGSDEQYRSGELARKAGPGLFTMPCDRGAKTLNWDTVGDKRWRIILKPSVDVAKKYPPIREFYGREFVTDWLTFERSPQFEQHRQFANRNQNQAQGYGGSIRADTPIDLDVAGRRWRGQGETWPLPAGFELGWSSDNGGTLRIDPNSGVKLLPLPEANARLIRATDQTRARLAELPRSQTTLIVPPKGEPTLVAVLSSEGRVYFVSVTKVDQTWANLRWSEDQEGTKQIASGRNERRRLIGNLPGGGTVELVAVRKTSAPDQPWYSPDGRVWIDPNTDPDLSRRSADWGSVAGGEGPTYEFFARADLPDKTGGVVNVAWRFNPAELAVGGGGSFFVAGQRYLSQVVQFPTDVSFVDVTLEISADIVTFRHVSLKNGWYMNPTIGRSLGASKKLTVTPPEQQEIAALIGQLGGTDEAVWRQASQKLKEMGPKVAGPLSDLFPAGGPLDVRLQDILGSMAADEHVQAVMLENLKLDPTGYPNMLVVSEAVRVLAESGNRHLVPFITPLLDQKPDPGSAAMIPAVAEALGKLGGDEAYDALCKSVVRDMAPYHSLYLDLASALVKLGKPEGAAVLEVAFDRMNPPENNSGMKMQLGQLIFRLSGGELFSEFGFNVTVFDKNERTFGQYIGADLIENKKSNYVQLTRYGMKAGDSPEDVFAREGRCAFYIRRGYEFVGVRGTIVAPITLPRVETDGRAHRLNWLTPRSIIEQIIQYKASHPSANFIKLDKDIPYYAVIDPNNRLLAMRPHIGTSEDSDESVAFDFTVLADLNGRSDLKALIRQASHFVDKGSGEGALVEVSNAGSNARGTSGQPSDSNNASAGDALKLLVAPGLDEFSRARIEEYEKSLDAGELTVDGQFAWFEAGDADAFNGTALILHPHKGRTYMLLHYREPFAMLPEQGWRLLKAVRTFDASGRKAIGLQFDEKAGDILYRLTRDNISRCMAIVLNGRVVSAPTINAAIGREAIIAGSFTDEEIERMLVALKPEIVESATDHQRGGDLDSPMC
jgi:beta-lactamase regulating signal transducer with metallopeptidase domain